MKKLDEIINNKLFEYIILLFSMLMFVISYVLKDSSNFMNILTIKDILFSIFISFMLICSKNTTNALFLLLLWPFSTFSDPRLAFAGNIFKITILVASFIHYIIYRPRIVIGKYTLGLWIYFIGLGMGGFLSDKFGGLHADNLYQPIELFIKCLLIYPILIIFFTSTVEDDFNGFSNKMVYLFVLILFELIVFNTRYLPNIFDFRGKDLDLKWGIHNNVATMLLVTQPFILYKAYQYKDKLIVSFIFILLYLINVISIIVIISKGAILAEFIGLALYILLFFVYSKNKKIYSLCTISIILIASVLCFIFYKTNTNYINGFKEYLNMETMHSREIIYKDAIVQWKKAPIFGIGFFGSFHWIVETGNLQFAHNTFLEMLVISGVVGLLCLIYHIFDKYYRLIKKPSIMKFVVLLSFLIPGIYGLIDVTYLLIPFTLTLIIEMVYSNKILLNISCIANTSTAD